MAFDRHVCRAAWRKRALSLVALVSLFFGGSGFAQEMIEVRIAAYRFEPAEVRISVGGTVRWLNQEKRTSHSIVFPQENGLESPRLFPEESWQRRFDQAGRYAYQCGPHPEMQGVVHVGTP